MGGGEEMREAGGHHVSKMRKHGMELSSETNLGLSVRPVNYQEGHFTITKHAI